MVDLRQIEHSDRGLLLTPEEAEDQRRFHKHVRILAKVAVLPAEEQLRRPQPTTAHNILAQHQGAQQRPKLHLQHDRELPGQEDDQHHRISLHRETAQVNKILIHPQIIHHLLRVEEYIVLPAVHSEV